MSFPDCMLKRIADWLTLTKAERHVILFLAGTLLCGFAIRMGQKTFSSSQHFDYHAQDSTFAALSEARDDTLQKSDAAMDEADAQVSQARLNINEATKEQLIDLPGIGDKLATRIVDRRTHGGKFKSIEELRDIKGITEKRLEKIKPLISLE